MTSLPIARVGGCRNVREHRMDAALRTIDVQLNRAPPEEWRFAFEHPPGPSRVLFELSLIGNTVTFTAESTDDMADTLAAVDERIAAGNLTIERSAPR